MRALLVFKIIRDKCEFHLRFNAEFECILKKNKKYDKNGDIDSSWSVKMQDHVSCGFGYRVVCVDDRFTKDIVIYREKDCADKFVDATLSAYEYCKGFMKDHFNKKLIM